jgi:hypothetical protein
MDGWKSDFRHRFVSQDMLDCGYDGDEYEGINDGVDLFDEE